MTVALFDDQGRLVRTLVDRTSLSAGEHSARIDGRGEREEALPSGAYFYRVRAPDGTITGRFSILK
jgi:flagellar hook assembly protein FlgD